MQANTDLVVDFPQIRSVLYSKGFEDLAKDQYPSLEEVKEKLFGVEFNYAMAFSRRFALSKNGSLWYYQSTRNRIGDLRRNTPNLNKEYFFLAEALEEDMAKHG